MAGAQMGLSHGVTSVGLRQGGGGWGTRRVIVGWGRVGHVAWDVQLCIDCIGWAKDRL